MKLLILLAIVSFISAVPKYNECPPENDKCEFWLVIKEQLTMVQNKQKVLVYANKGKLHRYDEHPNNYTIKVSQTFLIFLNIIIFI